MQNLKVIRNSTAKNTKILFEQYHYLKTIARGCPDTFELLNTETGEIVGSCQIGIPATRHIDKNKVKEIRRLVLVPGCEKNTASFFIAKCLNYIKLTYPQIGSVIAYSDPNVGHSGTVYKASNFNFVGQSKPTECITYNGKFVHLRTFYNKTKNKHLTRQMMTDVLLSKGYKRQYSKGKLKFEYILRK